MIDVEGVGDVVYEMLHTHRGTRLEVSSTHPHLINGRTIYFSRNFDKIA